MDKLIYNYILDLKKKEIGFFERAAIIRQYLDDHNMSIRAFAASMELSKSTVEDWLLWNRMDTARYNLLIKQGYNHLDIYRSLRNNRQEKDQLPIERNSKITIILHDCINILRRFEKKIDRHSADYENLLSLRDQINRVMMYSEKNK